MGFIGLLLVIPVVLILVVGVDPRSPLMWLLTLGLAVSLAGAVWLLISRGFDRLSRGWMSQSDSGLDSRRRMLKNRAVRSRHERRLEELDEAGLRAHLERKPKDTLACEILCERLRTAGNISEYAREMEHLLTIDGQMSHEEACTRYHRLADLYLEQLNRPERAREMLQALIARFPGHYQATLARRRLERMAEQT